MLKTARRIAKAMARALVDLLALVSLFPVLAVTFTMYKIILLIVFYMLKDLSYRHVGAVVDAIKHVVSRLRDEGWDGLKVRFLAALDLIKSTSILLVANFSAWVDRQIARLTADLGSDASIAITILTV